MPTNGSSRQVAVALAVSAAIIIIMMAGSSGHPYSTNVGLFLETPHAPGTRARLAGEYRPTDSGALLCDGDACIPLSLPKHIPHTLSPGRQIMASGLWDGHVFEAREIVTPCHDNKP